MNIPQLTLVRLINTQIITFSVFVIYLIMMGILWFVIPDILRDNILWFALIPTLLFITFIVASRKSAHIMQTTQKRMDIWVKTYVTPIEKDTVNNIPKHSNTFTETEPLDSILDDVIFDELGVHDIDVSSPSPCASREPQYTVEVEDRTRYNSEVKRDSYSYDDRSSDWSSSDSSSSSPDSSSSNGD